MNTTPSCFLMKGFNNTEVIITNERKYLKDSKAVVLLTSQGGPAPDGQFVIMQRFCQPAVLLEQQPSAWGEQTH